jgi:predicted acetyltransferase
MQIQRLSANDFEEAVDFVNLVFSLTYGPMNFEKLFPRFYKPTDEHMRRNLAVKDNGRIRALVGLYPSEMVAEDIVLKLGAIGAVSCHPNDRGKGWMKLLMDGCIEEMVQEDYDLSVLAGLRQRYMYFGFEKAGVMLEYKIGKTNLRHFHDDDIARDLKFLPMQASDVQAVEKAKALHDAQPVHCQRPLSEFYLYLISMNMQPWVALHPDGSMAGYLAANPEKNRISEIFAETDMAFAAMIWSWVSQQSIKEVSITLPPWAQGYARCLGGMAEDVLVSGSGNWRILNWHKAVKALLLVKSRQQRLQDGTLCVGIKGYDKIGVQVHNGTATCQRSTDRADVEWDPFTATRILFGHVPPSGVTVIPDFYGPLVASWFPLPLSWLPADHV